MVRIPPGAFQESLSIGKSVTLLGSDQESGRAAIIDCRSRDPYVHTINIAVTPFLFLFFKKSKTEFLV